MCTVLVLFDGLVCAASFKDKATGASDFSGEEQDVLDEIRPE